MCTSSVEVQVLDGQPLAMQGPAVHQPLVLHVICTQVRAAASDSQAAGGWYLDASRHWPPQVILHPEISRPAAQVTPHRHCMLHHASQPGIPCVMLLARKSMCCCKLKGNATERPCVMVHEGQCYRETMCHGAEGHYHRETTCHGE